MRSNRTVNNVQWTVTQERLRKGVAKALTDIRSGSVDELELNRLHNFCMVALSLLSQVSPHEWERAENIALHLGQHSNNTEYKIHQHRE